MAETFCLLLRRDLSQVVPDAQWPDGIGLFVYCEELAPQVHQLMQLGQRQGGGRVPSLDDWQKKFASDPEYDPSLCFVACDAEGVVGVAHCWTSSYIKNLVVHPRIQGQGLGRALLLHAFSGFQQRREGFVDLRVLEDNLRAQGLYESVGMFLVRRELVVE